MKIFTYHNVFRVRPLVLYRGLHYFDTVKDVIVNRNADSLEPPATPKSVALRLLYRRCEIVSIGMVSLLLSLSLDLAAVSRKRGAK
jgi:hypothetical protein